jgi:hypothetical protein
MSVTLKQMLDTANAVVPRITPAQAQAQEMIAQGNTLVVDVRDAPRLDRAARLWALSLYHAARSNFVPILSRLTTIRNFTRTKSSSFIALREVVRPSAASCSRIWAMTEFTISARSRNGPRAVVRSTSIPCAGHWASARLRAADTEQFERALQQCCPLSIAIQAPPRLPVRASPLATLLAASDRKAKARRRSAV